MGSLDFEMPALKIGNFNCRTNKQRPSISANCSHDIFRNMETEGKVIKTDWEKSNE